MAAEAALVLFSGGQDSTTCLAWALERYQRVETIGFDYGQRHSVELECRKKILAKIGSVRLGWREKLGSDHMIDLRTLGSISDTALTQDVAIQLSDSKLPNTFVPGRNLIFLAFSGAVAYRRGIKRIITGVCETDFSGYPDCRDDTVKAMQLALNLGMEQRFVIETPLMWIDKSDTWSLAEKVGGNDLIQLILTDTHTCYLGQREHLHEWGYGCGVCPACQLRKTGFEKFSS